LSKNLFLLIIAFSLGLYLRFRSIFKAAKVVPITITVKGAKAASNIRELQDAFYRSVISGVWEVSQFKKKEARLKESTQKYAPWVVRKITEAFTYGG